MGFGAASLGTVPPKQVGPPSSWHHLFGDVGASCVAFTWVRDGKSCLGGGSSPVELVSAACVSSPVQLVSAAWGYVSVIFPGVRELAGD